MYSAAHPHRVIGIFLVEIGGNQKKSSGNMRPGGGGSF